MDIGLPVLLPIFVIALVFGAVVNRTGFCTMGAVSDWVNMGDLGRLHAWLVAVAVALAASATLEGLGIIDLDDSRIPYRASSFAWPRYLLGGALFGIGMSLAGGCTSKNLVRLGAGNLKSLVVLLMVAAGAYLMTRTNFYAVVFLSWMAPLTPDLARFGVQGQDLGALGAALTGTERVDALRAVLAALLATGLLIVALRSADFRARRDHLLGGVVVGAAVAGGWYVTGGSIGQAWMEAVAFSDRPPQGVGVQSFTFVNPTADTLALAMAGGDGAFVTFGVAALAGVILGSLIYALASRGWRLEWFHTWRDLGRHLLGGALMGIGGVLALGCTIGQGVTGLSTLALGSLLATFSIVLASALTMKVEYYRMLHEEASFGAALLSALVDLRLAPASLRRLQAL